MRLETTRALDLLRIYWAHERGQLQWIVSNALLLPGMMVYVGLKVSSGNEGNSSWWLAGGITAAVGMTAMSQAGFAVLNDRFEGRLPVVMAHPVRRRDYVVAQLCLPVLQCVAIALVYLAILRWIGAATLSAGGWWWMMGVVAAGGVAMAAFGTAIAARAGDLATGGAALAVGSLALTIASPVYYDPSSLPVVLREAVWLLPLTPTAVAIRELIAFDSASGSTLLVAVATALLYVVLAMRSLKC